jgi:hypothetical protein
MATEIKTARKRITEQVLIERLSLDKEWLDPENIHVHFLDQLPESIRKQKGPTLIRDVERDIDRLVAHGCHRGVVYWCLERLAPEEEQFRLKGAATPVLEDQPGTQPIPAQPLATREALSPLISQLRSVSGMLQRYKREFLFAAEAFEGQIPLPDGLLTDGPSDPIEALFLLQASLTWVRKLAENWAAPQLTTIMRSKGTLYLLAYVSMQSKPNEPRHNPGAETKAGAALGSTGLLRRADARVIAHIVYACSDIAVHEDDMITKLGTFRRDHPALYYRLLSLVEHLHAAAQSTGPSDV